MLVITTILFLVCMENVSSYAWMAKQMQAGKIRAQSDSICDRYTTALLTTNTAANQYTLLTLLVNTVVIGNYTQPNVGVTVPGILSTQMYNGEEVNLLPYFTGELNSSNVDGKASQVNFLDGGVAQPLLSNLPADDTTSNQYFLLTHLYQFFGTLLGCSLQSNTTTGDFPVYSGDTSMFEAHKFMNLSANEMGYFISQVGLAASSFGVTDDDVSTVATALNSLFNLKCLPATAVVTTEPELQSICIGDGCTLASPSDCAAYTASSTTSSSDGKDKFPRSSIIAIVVSIVGFAIVATVIFVLYYYVFGGASHSSQTKHSPVQQSVLI